MLGHYRQRRDSDLRHGPPPRSACYISRHALVDLHRAHAGRQFPDPAHGELPDRHLRSRPAELRPEPGRPPAPARHTSWRTAGPTPRDHVHVRRKGHWIERGSERQKPRPEPGLRQRTVQVCRRATTGVGLASPHEDQRVDTSSWVVRVGVATCDSHRPRSSGATRHSSLVGRRLSARPPPESCWYSALCGPPPFSGDPDVGTDRAAVCLSFP